MNLIQNDTDVAHEVPHVTPRQVVRLYVSNGVPRVTDSSDAFRRPARPEASIKDLVVAAPPIPAPLVTGELAQGTVENVQCLREDISIRSINHNDACPQGA